MSKLFTPRGLLIQLMLYLIGRAILTLIKSEMKTTQISGNSSSSIILSGSSPKIQDARKTTQDLLNAINGN